MDNKFFGFFKRHKIITTIIAIMAVDVALLLGCYLSLGWFTHHDEFQIVPELKGMMLADAEAELHSKGLKYEISDSVFDNSSKPGTIIMQTPKAGSKIKNDRTIYITIRSFATKQVKLPSVADMSLRQAQTTLQSAGLTNIKIERVPSEYSDLVISMRMNGLPLRAGDMIPVNSTITLIVGDGSLQQIMMDSLAIDGEPEELDLSDIPDETEL